MIGLSDGDARRLRLGGIGGRFGRWIAGSGFVHGVLGTKDFRQSAFPRIRFNRGETLNRSKPSGRYNRKPAFAPIPFLNHCPVATAGIDCVAWIPGFTEIAACFDGTSPLC